MFSLPVVVSVGEGVRVEHLVFVRRDKSNQRVADQKETSVLLELGRQVFEVRGFRSLEDVPVHKHFRSELGGKRF